MGFFQFFSVSAFLLAAPGIEPGKAQGTSRNHFFFVCSTLELEFVDGGDIGFNFQHQNAYDSLIQIHTVEYVRIVICFTY